MVDRITLLAPFRPDPGENLRYPVQKCAWVRTPSLADDRVDVKTHYFAKVPEWSKGPALSYLLLFNLLALA